jgi:hypothetical protein
MMGTRCLTIIHDEAVPLICMRRQFDGYLRGHGLELARFLIDMKIVNGLGLEREQVANGAGCLAAQMIAYFKNKPGNIYIEPMPDEDTDHVDYVYKVMVDSGKITVEVTGDGNNFKGTVSEFASYCKEQ